MEQSSPPGLSSWDFTWFHSGESVMTTQAWLKWFVWFCMHFQSFPQELLWIRWLFRRQWVNAQAEFRFLDLGRLAYLGQSQAVAELGVGSTKVSQAKGTAAFLLWRSVYIAPCPTRSTEKNQWCMLVLVSWCHEDSPMNPSRVLASWLERLEPGILPTRLYSVIELNSIINSYNGNTKELDTFTYIYTYYV